MTKKELIDFLLPFTDEIEICLIRGPKERAGTEATYEMTMDGEGIVSLFPSYHFLKEVRDARI
jgi:hypothetical protein